MRGNGNSSTSGTGAGGCSNDGTDLSIVGLGAAGIAVSRTGAAGAGVGIRFVGEGTEGGGAPNDRGTISTEESVAANGSGIVEGAAGGNSIIAVPRIGIEVSGSSLGLETLFGAGAVGSRAVSRTGATGAGAGV